MTVTKVAVLGGGPAAMAAAYELTDTADLRRRYEVTVHTLGWRLGGKGASGRNARIHNRIEEHGLHIWFGFYDNAFNLIRRCYTELDRPKTDPACPIKTWTDAFHPGDDLIEYEEFDGKWIPYLLKLPRNDFTPGDPAVMEFWELVERVIGYLAREWDRLHPKHGLLGRFARQESLRLVHEHAQHHAAMGKEAGIGLGILTDMLDHFRDWVWKHVVSKHLADNDLRFFFLVLDFVAAMLRGIHDDRLIERGFGAANGEELRPWLKRHGASELTLTGSPIVRGIYDAAFCYDHGDPKQANIAAGKAIQDVVRLGLLYKGALYYKMQAGMGDTIFGPLYEVLRARGVKFEFFRCVTGLHLDASGKTVEEIEVIQQVELNQPEYDPLYPVDDLPCWPNEPFWKQIKRGDELERRGVNLEQDVNPFGHDPLRLRRGEDFDEIVLGIPVGALPPICGELAAANPRFKKMLDNSATVMTQAFQLWVKPDREELGWPYAQDSLTSAFTEPVNTWCDMTHLVPHEDWGPGEVGMLAYFTAALSDKGIRTQEDADKVARDNALAFIKGDLQKAWPGAFRGGQFDWDILVAPDGVEGEARFDAQYARANFTGTERYVLSLAGSIAYRLASGESGFDNLVLAGDWTRNGVDAGSVEAAVTSGMQASQAISGYPKEILGLTGWLESDKGEKPVTHAQPG